MKRLSGKIPGREIVLQVGGEGGSLTLVRYPVSDETWEFAIIRDETTLAGFLEEGEMADLFESQNAISTFDDAIKLMNKYPWQYLFPLAVHPEYVKEVLSIIDRMGDPCAKDRWQHLLGS